MCCNNGGGEKMQLTVCCDDNSMILTICDKHQEMLKNTIDMYDLTKFISKNESIANSIIERSLAGEEFMTAEDFDPLLMMDFIMWKKSIQFYKDTGINLSKDDNCVMCEYEKNDDPSKWIDEAILSTVEVAKDLGFFSVQ
jgi:hypothetical protein